MDEKQPVQPQKHTGHRQRLRKRFLEAGIGALSDYEIIELLLTYAIPRRDVKPDAKALFDNFNDLQTLFNADADDLLSCRNIGESSCALLLLIKELCTKLQETPHRKHPGFNNKRELETFIKTKIAGLKYEALIVLYLDSGNSLIKAERSNGTKNYLHAYPLEIARHAVTLRASGVIIAHNHPGGSCQPSPQDIAMTRILFDALQAVGVKLTDHLIVSGDGINSVLPMLKF